MAHLESLSVLVAEREIRDKLYRYCRSIDRCDAELLRSVYHDDAFDDHGARFRGRADAYVAWVLPYLRDNFVRTMHRLHNILIEVDGEQARVETYCVADHIRRRPDGTPFMSTFVLRYVDRFENRPAAGWRIAHRVVVKEWRAESPLSADAWDDEGYITSRMGPDDVVFQAALPQREPTTSAESTSWRATSPPRTS